MIWKSRITKYPQSLSIAHQIIHFLIVGASLVGSNQESENGAAMGTSKGPFSSPQLCPMHGRSFSIPGLPALTLAIATTENALAHMQTASGVSGNHPFKQSQLMRGLALIVCKLGPDPPPTSLHLGLLCCPVEGHTPPAGPLGVDVKEGVRGAPARPWCVVSAQWPGLAPADPSPPSTLMVSPSDRAKGGLQSPPDCILL